MQWFGALFIAAVAVLLVIQRREVARLQANVLGGSIPPGCVIAEAIALFVLAIVLWVVNAD